VSLFSLYGGQLLVFPRIFRIYASRHPAGAGDFRGYRNRRRSRLPSFAGWPGQHGQAARGTRGLPTLFSRLPAATPADRQPRAEFGPGRPNSAHATHPHPHETDEPKTAPTFIAWRENRPYNKRHEPSQAQTSQVPYLRSQGDAASDHGRRGRSRKANCPRRRS